MPLPTFQVLPCVYGFISLFPYKCFDHFSSRPRTEQSLVRWATPQLHDIDALAKMVDPALNGMYPAKSLSRFADVIALCVQVTSLTIISNTNVMRPPFLF